MTRAGAKPSKRFRCSEPVEQLSGLALVLFLTRARRDARYALKQRLEGIRGRFDDYRRADGDRGSKPAPPVPSGQAPSSSSSTRSVHTKR